MKVEAKFTSNKHGFYGGIRRYDGDEFLLSDPKHFSDKWMVKVEEKKKPGPKPKSGSTEIGGE